MDDLFTNPTLLRDFYFCRNLKRKILILWSDIFQLVLSENKFGYNFTSMMPSKMYSPIICCEIGRFCLWTAFKSLVLSQKVLWRRCIIQKISILEIRNSNFLNSNNNLFSLYFKIKVVCMINSRMILDM